MAGPVQRGRRELRLPIKIKVLIAALILAPVFAHLFYAFTHSTLANYYLTVEELMAQEEMLQGRTVRVGGPVVAGSIQWDNADHTLRFTVAGDGQVLPIVYRDLVPNAFREGATVILEGELTAAGAFAAYSLMVKCPHKYVPAL